MTDPKVNKEPASNPEEEFKYKATLLTLAAIQLGKAYYYSLKSNCAECGSNRGIDFDFPKSEDKIEQVASGVVIGRCAHCGESTAIGLYYAPGDEELKNPEVFRVSRSTMQNPQQIDIAV